MQSLPQATGGAAMRARACTIATLAALALATVISPAHGAPLIPANDAQVVEILPAARGARGQERQWQQRLASNPLAWKPFAST